jgi:tRNA dimethylallyltransferase
MGYREAFDVLSGRLDLANAQAVDASRTWAYARRQRTWFRSEPGVLWLEAGEGVVERAWSLLAAFCRPLGRGGYAGRP